MTLRDEQIRNLRELAEEFGNGEGLAIAFDLGVCYYCKHSEHGRDTCTDCGCTDAAPVHNRDLKAGKAEQ